jgi:hypothetical protein
MIISHSKNFVFIHLEKTGGTSIEFALDPILSDNDIIIGSTPRGEAEEGMYGHLWKHSSAQDIKSYLGDQWEGMYKFATIRNPIEIVISLYYYSQNIMSRFIPINDKNLISFFNMQHNPVVDSWKKEMPYMLDYYDSFINGTYLNGFIQSLSNGQSHFNLQTQSSRLDESVDLFNIENINRHWPTIQKNVGVSDIPLGHVNKSRRPNDIFLHPNTIDAINTFFQEDYEMLSDLV